MLIGELEGEGAEEAGAEALVSPVVAPDADIIPF